MNTPQIIIIALLALNLGMHLAKHGEPRVNTNYSFWWQCVDTAAWVWLLKWGGFFA